MVDKQDWERENLSPSNWKFLITCSSERHYIGTHHIINEIWRSEEQIWFKIPKAVCRTNSELKFTENGL